MRNDELTSTRAGATPQSRWTAALRYADIVLVLLATAPALALGAPALGYLVGAFAWLGQRALAQVDRRWIRQAKAPQTRLGLNMFEAFGRIWLLAGAIVAAGVIGGRADGLTAALTIFGAYSAAFAVKVIGGPPPPAERAQTAASARPQAAATARSGAPTRPAGGRTA